MEAQTKAGKAALAKSDDNGKGGDRREASGMLVRRRPPLAEYNLSEEIFNFAGDDSEFLKLMVKE
eukprot:2942294-Pleurochrysis_carterae.AAC.1